MCKSANIIQFERVSCQHFYLFKAEQQVSCSNERGPLGSYGSSDDITEMSQLIAALHDECQGIVVVGSQLVTMQNHHLGTSHLLLKHHGINACGSAWSLCLKYISIYKCVFVFDLSMFVQQLQIFQKLFRLNHCCSHRGNLLFLS